MGTEFLPGIARAFWLVPVVGDLPSRQIGVFTGSVINLTIATLFEAVRRERLIAG
jgi:hypothetical protein